MPFLTQDWTEARRRFSRPWQRSLTTIWTARRGDLIQFKNPADLPARGQREDGRADPGENQGVAGRPGFYYAQAALALRHEDRQEARVLDGDGGKGIFAAIEQAFAESFYEVGWLPKAGGRDAWSALEVTSPAERLARAQADLARAERAYRRRDLEGAWQLLDQVDATAPNQAVTYTCEARYCSTKGRSMKPKRLCGTRWRPIHNFRGRALQPGASAFAQKTTRLRARNWRRSSVQSPVARKSRENG